MESRKLDLRIVRTRKLLSEALIQLILEVDYDRISIRQLTETASVGYATFYRHFKSKDELLEYALIANLGEFVRTLRPGMTQREEALEFFKHIDEKRDAYRAGLAIPRDHPAIKAVHDYTARFAIDRYQPRGDCGIPFEIAINHLIVSAYEFIRWYLDNDDRYSLEQMALFYDELIVKSTESAAFELRQKQASAGL